VQGWGGSSDVPSPRRRCKCDLKMAEKKEKEAPNSPLLYRGAPGGQIQSLERYHLWFRRAAGGVDVKRHGGLTGPRLYKRTLEEKAATQRRGEREITVGATEHLIQANHNQWRKGTGLKKYKARSNEAAEAKGGRKRERGSGGARGRHEK